VCGHHAVLRTLVGKAFLQGFFWPTAVADANWSCALARGANSTPARPISQRMPSKRFPSHGLSPWGGWTSSGPCERRPGATLTCWLP
jgi:hypothetical protein